jgi:signal peptidase I
MDKKRGVPARVGVVLLNLLAPGLGLLRLARWNTALLLFSISTIVLLFWRFGPPVPFSVLIATLVLGLASLGAGIWLTWKFSRELTTDRPRYARWYGVLGAATVAIIINIALTNPEHRRYRSFYMPSESMAPSLLTNDRLIGYMRASTALQRGDLVLVRTVGGAIYLKRVAAIAGDRIAMKNGVVVLNSATILQRPMQVEMTKGSFGIERAQRLEEQFPGEKRPHQIYDIEREPADDLAEIQVPAGAVYLLGDNRDRSADSRVPAEEGGLGGPVSISRIAGVPLYVSWGSSKPMGTGLSR